MLKTKKLAALFLAFTLILPLCAVWGAPALAYSGNDYTGNVEVAAKLDSVLNGTAKIFKNSDSTFKMGDSLNNSFAYAWGNTWGYQCLAYARGVYYYLFGEDADYAGKTYTNAYLALGPSDRVSKLSYSVLSEAGVGCGAYVRTTANWDYSYNTSNGHSFLILSYDEDTMTFLEGNANGRGLIALNTYTWDEFNTRRLVNAGRRISFVIQPYDTCYTIPGNDGEKPTKVPVTMPVTTTAPAPTTEPFSFDISSLQAIPGDVDLSGHVDSSDARVALRAAVGLESFNAESKEFKVLDINSDGDITADDARVILRISVGLPIR